MKYIEKSTKKMYTFVEINSLGYYVLERDVDISVNDGKITKEGIGIPLEVLQSDFELVEEKDNE